MLTFALLILSSDLQPSMKYKPGYCFSAISADDTAVYMQMLNEMRRSAKLAESAGSEKLGRSVMGQVEMVEKLMMSLQDQHVCWNVKIQSVTGDRIGIMPYNSIRFTVVESKEPWIKKLKKGDTVTIKGIVTKMESANKTMIELPLIMVVDEITMEQHKLTTPRK